MDQGDLFKGLTGRKSLDIKQEGSRVKLSGTVFNVNLRFNTLPPPPGKSRGRGLTDGKR